MTFEEILIIVESILKYPLFTINQTTVTLTSLFMLLLIMIGVMVISKIFIKSILTHILSKTKLEPGKRYTFARIAHYIVMVLGGVIAFQFIGVDLSGLIVIFGFLSVGIGFGLQNITSNFISGLILLFERPIAVGDRVVVGNTEGDVEEIHIRSTVIRTLNNISIIVPNTEFVSSNVINWSHADPKVILDIPVGVSYDSDLDLVINTLKEIAKDNAEVLATPVPEVLFKEFGDSSWNLDLRVWIENPKTHWHVRSDINSAIVRKFREHNIEIPFPQRDLHIRSSVQIPVNSGS